MAEDIYKQARAVNYNLKVKPPKNKKELYNNASTESFYSDQSFWDNLKFEELQKGFEEKYPEYDIQDESGNPNLDEAAKIQMRRDNREDRIFDRFQRGNERVAERIRNNPDKTEELVKKNERRAERFKARAERRAENAAESDLNPDSESLGGKFAGAGISALQQAPSVIQNLSTDPQNSKEATGKVLSLASSGAQIGMSFGPWGALAGAAVGAGAGIISNRDWKGKIVREEDKELTKQLGDDIAERQQNYYLNKTQEQIASEREIYARSLGYS